MRSSPQVGLRIFLQKVQAWVRRDWAPHSIPTTKSIPLISSSLRCLLLRLPLLTWSFWPVCKRVNRRTFISPIHRGLLTRRHLSGVYPATTAPLPFHLATRPALLI